MHFILYIAAILFYRHFLGVLTISFCYSMDRNEALGDLYAFPWNGKRLRHENKHVGGNRSDGEPHSNRSIRRINR